MSLRDTLREKLGSELYTKVIDALGDDMNYDLVPRSRLNEVIRQRDEARDQLANFSGSQTKAGKGVSNIDDPDDTKASQNPGNQQLPKSTPKQVVDEEALRKQFAQEKENAILELKIQYAALDALRNANSVDPDLAFTLLDKSKLAFGEDGKLTGIEEQLTTMKENKSYLFAQGKATRDTTPGGTGKTGGGSQFESVTTKEAFLKLNTKDQLAFKNAHPEIFKRFLEDY